MFVTEYIIKWKGVKGIYVRAIFNKYGSILGWGIFEGQNFILSKIDCRFHCLPEEMDEEFFVTFTFKTAEDAISICEKNC
jgi:hypothetical protein